MGVNVAYPGRDGAHSAAACDNLFPTGTELVPLPSFTAVVAATAGGEVAFGVLPIRHCLVGPTDVPLEEIRVVRSHPAALDQCRRLLAAMPWATAIAAATTADAAHQVAEHGDPQEVAIASERAAQAYDLVVIAGDVGDHPEAYTRFVSVAPYTRLDRESEAWRTAFSFITDHKPGALHRAIEPFGRHSLDMVQLVSRPIPQTPWRYRFDAVLAGHPLDAVVAETLAEVAGLTRELRVFGSYPAHE